MLAAKCVPSNRTKEPLSYILSNVLKSSLYWRGDYRERNSDQPRN